MKKVFIDGKSGTTGLKIYDRLKCREDIELIVAPESERRSPQFREAALNGADIVFLCLPDDAAREAVKMIKNEKTTVIDSSTAHRTQSGWAYGFPELSQEQADNIKSSKRIAAPGCHASGFIALVKPLISAGIINPDILLSCFSVTGYSGGGKKMIAEYEKGGNVLLNSPRQYALSQEHKHLKEMKIISGVRQFPAFCPTVGNFYSGMCVSVPLFSSQLNSSYKKSDIIDIYKEKYNSPILSYNPYADADGFLSAAALSGKDRMEVSVFGNGERILLCARYDNLGKGASGAAVQCLNISLGTEQTKGLEL